MKSLYLSLIIWMASIKAKFKIKNQPLNENIRGFTPAEPAPDFTPPALPKGVSTFDEQSKKRALELSSKSNISYAPSNISASHKVVDNSANQYNVMNQQLVNTALLATAMDNASSTSVSNDCYKRDDYSSSYDNSSNSHSSYDSGSSSDSSSSSSSSCDSSSSW